MTNLLSLPTLDAHAHLKYAHSASDLSICGVVLAMTVSLEEATHTVARNDQTILWGIGCHPGEVDAQQKFDEHTFSELIKHTPVVGEIGLDKKSPVPFNTQLKTFRTILRHCRGQPPACKHSQQSRHSRGSRGTRQTTDFNRSVALVECIQRKNQGCSPTGLLFFDQPCDCRALQVQQACST